MWCSDWTEILCWNVSWLEEHPLKISRDLDAQFGRCFRTAGASWARRSRFVVIWHCRRALSEGIVALSEGTSLGHRKIASYVFSKILYGGSWDGMRSGHKL